MNNIYKIIIFFLLGIILYYLLLSFTKGREIIEGFDPDEFIRLKELDVLKKLYITSDTEIDADVSTLTSSQNVSIDNIKLEPGTDNSIYYVQGGPNGARTEQQLDTPSRNSIASQSRVPSELDPRDLLSIDYSDTFPNLNKVVYEMLPLVEIQYALPAGEQSSTTINITSEDSLRGLISDTPYGTSDSGASDIQSIRGSYIILNGNYEINELNSVVLDISGSQIAEFSNSVNTDDNLYRNPILDVKIDADGILSYYVGDDRSSDFRKIYDFSSLSTERTLLVLTNANEPIINTENEEVTGSNDYRNMKGFVGCSYNNTNGNIAIDELLRGRFSTSETIKIMLYTKPNTDPPSFEITYQGDPAAGGQNDAVFGNRDNVLEFARNMLNLDDPQPTPTDALSSDDRNDYQDYAFFLYRMIYGTSSGSGNQILIYPSYGNNSIIRFFNIKDGDNIIDNIDFNQLSLNGAGIYSPISSKVSNKLSNTINMYRFDSNTHFTVGEQGSITYSNESGNIVFKIGADVINFPRYISLVSYIIDKEVLVSDTDDSNIEITNLGDLVTKGELLLALISKTNESGSNLSGGCASAGDICQDHQTLMNRGRPSNIHYSYRLKSRDLTGDFLTCSDPNGPAVGANACNYHTCCENTTCMNVRMSNAENPHDVCSVENRVYLPYNNFGGEDDISSVSAENFRNYCCGPPIDSSISRIFNSIVKLRRSLTRNDTSPPNDAIYLNTDSEPLFALNFSENSYAPPPSQTDRISGQDLINFINFGQFNFTVADVADADSSYTPPDIIADAPLTVNYRSMFNLTQYINEQFSDTLNCTGDSGINSLDITCKNGLKRVFRTILRLNKKIKLRGDVTGTDSVVTPNFLQNLIHITVNSDGTILSTALDAGGGDNDPLNFGELTVGDTASLDDKFNILLKISLKNILKYFTDDEQVSDSNDESEHGTLTIDSEFRGSRLQNNYDSNTSDEILILTPTTGDPLTTKDILIYIAILFLNRYDDIKIAEFGNTESMISAFDVNNIATKPKDLTFSQSSFQYHILHN